MGNKDINTREDGSIFVLLSLSYPFLARHPSPLPYVPQLKLSPVPTSSRPLPAASSPLPAYFQGFDRQQVFRITLTQLSSAKLRLRNCNMIVVSKYKFKLVKIRYVQLSLPGYMKLQH